MSMELKQIEPKEAVSASKFPLLDRRGGCAIKKMVAFLAGADGVVDQAPKSIRSAARALTYLTPRRSRSKTIARVFPSCPGGEIGSAIRLSIIAVVVLLNAVSAYAHDIPNDVTIHMFLKPRGQRVQLLVRAPLAAMQDVQYAKLPNGYVDLSQIDFPLRNSAKLWISNNFQLFENDVLLPDPEI